MANYRNGRKLLSVTCKEDLYQSIKDCCDELDLPVSVWARKVLEREAKKHHANKELV